MSTTTKTQSGESAAAPATTAITFVNTTSTSVTVYGFKTFEEACKNWEDGAGAAIKKPELTNLRPRQGYFGYVFTFSIPDDDLRVITRLASNCVAGFKQADGGNYYVVPE